MFVIFKFQYILTLGNLNENRLKHLPDITIKDASETMFKEINFNKGLTPRLPREISQYYAYGLRLSCYCMCGKK